MNLVRTPINLSAFPHPGHFDRAAPDPGEDSANVLAAFGYTDEEITALTASGTVGE